MNSLTFAALALSVFCLGSAPAGAALTLLYGTDFNAPAYSDGALTGQDGWAITGGSFILPITVANTATNGSVTLATSGQDVNHSFSATTLGGSVYVSASINVASAQAAGDYFLHVGEAGTNNFYGRVYARSSDAGYVMALGTSSGTAVTYGSLVLPFGTPTRIMFRYDIIAGAANDTGALFVNPVSGDGSLDTPYAAATNIGIDATTISMVNLRQGTLANAPVVTVDNLTVSIPEPSAGLLGAVAALGFIRRRR